VRHVIIGAGLAGVSAAEALREEGGPGEEIVILGGEPELPYDHPPLSKGYLRGEAGDDEVRLHPRAWYEERGIDLRLGAVADAIDPGRHEVTLAGGARERYDRLLLATGGRPRRLPVPGSDLDGVLTLRTVGDADLIRAAATEAGRCAVVGGGFIGVEVAASLRALGAEVDLLMIEEHVLEGPLGRALGERLTALLRDRGVRVHPRAEVTAFHGESDLVSVAARGAPAIQVPVAVVGAGITPATELAEAAGLQTDLGGVACDQSFRTSAPDVFAAGDVAAVWSPLAGRRLRVEHWAEALNQGKLAARGMLDMEAAYDRVPYFFSDVFDSSIEYVGFGGPVEDEIAVERDGGLMAYHLSGDRLTGVAKLDVDDDLQGARELLRAGAGRAEVEAVADRSG